MTDTIGPVLAQIDEQQFVQQLVDASRAEGASLWARAGC